MPIYHRRQDELTVPLRDCCADCQRIIEECLKEGNDWTEKFSRGARRRRSASLEYNIKPAASHTRNVNGAFTPFSSDGSTSRDLNSRFATTASFSITVDEVDKRRRFDYSLDDTDLIPTQQSHPSASPFASSSGSSLYPRVKPRDREASSSSTASSVSTIDELLPGPDILDSRNRLCSSPIEEEDETQLFPLPRRSRSNTPSPPSSPNLNGSSSLCDTHEHLIAPTVSMTESWAINAASTLSSSQSLSLQLPTMGAPTRLVSHEPSDTESKPFPPIPSMSPSANTLSEISDQNTASLLAPTSSNLSFTDNINSIPPFKPKLEPAVTLTNHNPTPPSTISNHTSSLIAQKPSQQKRKISFSLPFIKAGGAIRDVGVDVLKGVSSISGGGGIVGSV